MTAALRTLAAAALAIAAQDPGPSADDRARLAEAFAVMRDVQDHVWPGWSQAPAALVLVRQDREYLMRSPLRPAGFEPLDADPVLGPLLARPRTFPPGFLATFPAFGPTPTIVVGTAGATGKPSTEWVLSVLHEHFHQLQYSDPGYWNETKALDLSGGDETGMWMLNYPFPYAEVSPRFAALAKELARLVEGAGTTRTDRDGFWRRYAGLVESLSPSDRRYLSLQLWQEGIARYAELRTAEAAARRRRPADEFRRLPDHRGYEETAAALRREMLRSLREDTMERQKREVVYAFGAAMGLLLDQDHPGWRSRYLREKFYLEKYRSPAGN